MVLAVIFFLFLYFFFLGNKKKKEIAPVGSKLKHITKQKTKYTPVSRLKSNLMYEAPAYLSVEYPQTSGSNSRLYGPNHDGSW